MAATMKIANEFNVAKYLIWKTTVKMNLCRKNKMMAKRLDKVFNVTVAQNNDATHHATGILKKISNNPTKAKNQD